MIPHFVLWKWKSATYRTPYAAAQVETACFMLRRMGVPADRIVCVTDDPTGIVSCRTHPLWSDHATMTNVSGPNLPSCYRRLKLFDPATQAAMGIPAGERVVSLDLDVVLLQDFLALFDRSEPYVGWMVPGTRHRIVMNGSMWMFTAGEYQWLWEKFDPATSPKEALRSGYMGSDQGYLSYRLFVGNNRGVGGWTAAQHGVLSYTRDVRQTRTLPKHAKVVFFAGKQKPWDPAVQKNSPWILRYVRPKQEAEIHRIEEAAHVAVA